MGREEIAVRLQQAFAKRWDVTLYKMGLPAVKDDRSNALGRGGRFFFQREELPGILSALSKQFPETAQQRSEEHTSELQSRLHLVCRLLLEKKKNTTNRSGNAYSLGQCMRR